MLKFEQKLPFLSCTYEGSLKFTPLLLLSAYFPFFHCRGLDFVTGFEEPDSALLPPSGSFWSSSFRHFDSPACFSFSP